MEDYFDIFVEDLLHINDGNSNKFIDMNAGDKAKTLQLLSPDPLTRPTGQYAIEIISKRFAKPANTALLHSAVGEQLIGNNINCFDWQDGNGVRDIAKLNKFIDEAYKELDLKGNNTLFICVGAIKWKVTLSTQDKEPREVVTPLLVFPIRLVRSATTSPICIEFVNDDAYFNPCLTAKIRQVIGDAVADGFPHPNGNDGKDEPIDLAKLGDGSAYFDAVKYYMESSRNEGSTFELNRDYVAIVQYSHDELCMYYDIKRNRAKILAHPLVQRVFSSQPLPPEATCSQDPVLVLEADSFQKNMINRVVNGESLIIKGPPGTGKTQTIVNMISALLAKGKRVLLASKKLSALGEVNAKMPAPLRKFVMMLASETEAQAAKVKPSVIRKDFRELLDEVRKYTPSATLDGDTQAAQMQISEEMGNIIDYYEDMYTDGSVVGRTYYDSLDCYFHNPDSPVVNCGDGEMLAALSQNDYNRLLSLCEEAGEHYTVMTGNGAHKASLCPWYNLNSTEIDEAAHGAYAKLAAAARTAIDDAKATFKVGHENLSILAVYNVMNAPISPQWIDEILNVTDGKAVAAVADVLKLCGEVEGVDVSGVKADLNELNALIEAITLPSDNVITVDECAFLAKYTSLFTEKDGKYLREETLTLIKSIVYEAIKVRNEQAAHRANARTVFNESDTLAPSDELVKACQSLSEYSSEDVKPKALDLKAKKGVKTISAITYRKNLPFGEMVAAAKEITASLANGTDYDTIVERLSPTFMKGLSDEEKVAIITFIERLGGGNGVNFIRSIADSHAAVAKLAASLGNGGDKVSDIVGKAKAVVALDKLINALKPNFSEEKRDAVASEPIALARALVAAYALFGDEHFYAYGVADKANIVLKLYAASEAKARIGELITGMTAFAQNHFASAFTDVSELNYGMLEIFAREADDDDVISAARRMYEITKVIDVTGTVRAFYDAFASGEVTANMPYTDIFEHSVFALANEYYCAKVLGSDRFGMGSNIDRSFTQLYKANEAYRDTNVLRIERTLMRAINPNADEYNAFNANGGASETLRQFFRNYANEILSLKKCMIISPSTASVLMRREEYENFDVVIVDEASQLEPVNLIPVLFRSKQCVIVGDEYQMPPIKHFAAKYEKRVPTADGQDTVVLEPEISALTLALRNNSFRAQELICHYRSKTESIIAFSQSNFYPNMRTFPATCPMKKGLGFVDVHVPTGYCEGGVNEVEAQKVVDIIREHFNEYYDAEKGTLSESIGVVAFGQSQIERIVSIVEHDKELNYKIETAKARFKDVPEKLIFFKTIETVQGQETKHLVLSITYGKTAKGVSSAFGQLNRDTLGKCIFNVAVTRAQCSVTIVHSVSAEQITGENVRYIRDYMLIADRYAREGRGQFVSTTPSKGFLRSVGEFIRSCGVSENRIVYDYGVTKGSVRMPIAVLDKDLKVAQLGVRCEIPANKRYHYTDYNVNYNNILIDCGWKLHPVYIHDWADNADKTRADLAAAVKKYVELDVQSGDDGWE